MKKTKIKPLKSLQQTQKTICLHQRLIQYDKKKYFCEKCGILSYKPLILSLSDESPTKTYFLVKPVSYYKPCDVNPIKLFQNLLSNHLLQQKEKESTNFPTWYKEIRSKQVSFLFSLQTKFKSSITTVFLAIEYIDVIYSIYKSKKSDYSIYLINVCCFILAFKYNEVENFTNSIYNFNKSFELRNSDDIKIFEVKCLKALRYNLDRITINHFLSLIKYGGFVLKSESKSQNDLYLKILYREVNDVLIEILTNKHSLLMKYNYAQIAFSIIYFIRGKHQFDSSLMENIISKELYKFPLIEYYKCVEMLKKYYNTKKEGDSLDKKEDQLEVPAQPIENANLLLVSSNKNLKKLVIKVNSSSKSGNSLHSFVNSIDVDNRVNDIDTGKLYNNNRNYFRSNPSLENIINKKNKYELYKNNANTIKILSPLKSNEPMSLAFSYQSNKNNLNKNNEESLNTLSLNLLSSYKSAKKKRRIFLASDFSGETEKKNNHSRNKKISEKLILPKL